jgi:hypothetical protein
LIELANRALAGQPTGGASLTDINTAVDNFNEAFDECQFVVYCGPVRPGVVPGLAGANDHSTPDALIPVDFFLNQSYPNPFNASATIDYGLPQDSHVSIDIYDILGGQVASLVNEDQTAGYHQVTWNAGTVPSGVYFYRIDAGTFIATKKMILMK